MPIRSASRVELAEGVYPDGHTDNAGDGHGRQLAIADFPARLEQHEPEGQYRDRVDHDHDGLGIEVKQQKRRRGEAKAESDGPDDERSTPQHKGCEQEVEGV